MWSVYQHWDPLQVCLVGKTYPPEFYSWISDSKTRQRFETLSQETEEDYQRLIDLLTKKFNVQVLRPQLPQDLENRAQHNRDRLRALHLAWPHKYQKILAQFAL